LFNGSLISTDLHAFSRDSYYIPIKVVNKKIKTYVFSSQILHKLETEELLALSPRHLGIDD